MNQRHATGTKPLICTSSTCLSLCRLPFAAGRHAFGWTFLLCLLFSSPQTVILHFYWATRFCPGAIVLPLGAGNQKVTSYEQGQGSRNSEYLNLNAFNYLEKQTKGHGKDVCAPRKDRRAVFGAAVERSACMCCPRPGSADALSPHLKYLFYFHLCQNQ